MASHIKFLSLFCKRNASFIFMVHTSVSFVELFRDVSTVCASFAALSSASSLIQSYWFFTRLSLNC